MWLNCVFYLFFFRRHAQPSNPVTDFDAWWLKMRGITQGCAFWWLKYLILTFNPYLPPKCQILPQNSNFKPKWWNMKVQVYQQLLSLRNWKFDTMLRTWNIVLRCNMMTSQQIQYGGRPPYWKSSFGYISAICCSKLTWNFVCWSTIIFKHMTSDQINNFRKFKMADDRRFENRFIAIFQQQIVRFQWNLVCRCRFRF